MKRVSFVAAMVVASAFLFSACRMHVLRGEGPKGTKTVSVGAFDKLDITTSSTIEVTVTEGAAQSVQLSGYENIMKHVKAEVTAGTLKISYDLDHTWQVDGDDLKLTITVPSLKALSTSGAPDANLHGNITGAEFNLDVSGASDITIDNINVDKFTADMSGASELTIKGGSVKQASYDVSGAGEIKAYPLQTEETVASISGAGEGQITASKKLDASISGAGEITYKGSPEVSQHVSGAGSVTAAGATE